jgi:sodium/hydrogen exchanger 8
LFKHTNIKQEPKHEVSLLLLFSYGAYALPEVFELSGIMSLFFCGVVLSHYNTYNLSPASKITAENLFKSMASLSEFVIFLYMGMGLFTNHFHPWNFGFIILTIIFCLIARALNIFPFSMLANLGRHKKISFANQIVMWFAGLRGAIAFVLARNMPGEHVGVYTTTTLASTLIADQDICRSEDATSDT